MRWILVFLFLYFIPLIVLFKNYNNKKRSFLYGSTYVILVTTIVTTNMYISGLNKIKEAMYYENYSFENEYTMDDFDNQNKDILYEAKSKEHIEEDKDIVVANNNENSNKNINTSNIKKEDKELIYKFKQEVYEIELKALIPMRECLPYTKNIAENLKKLDEVKKDLEYASYMCREVISLYKTMNIPQLSDDRYTEIIDDARNDVKMAYELREKAMESAITLITTKNPKYIGKITEYLSLSDNCISNFKDRLTDLNKIIDKQ
jgi:hypothetical protein